jgi:putative membrane protein
MPLIQPVFNLEPGTMTLLADVWTANSFEMSLLAAAVFGLLGIAMLVLGYKVFEWITPKLNVEEELTKGNVAVGIAVGALLLAISLIVVRAIGG